MTLYNCRALFDIGSRDNQTLILKRRESSEVVKSIGASNIEGLVSETDYISVEPDEYGYGDLIYQGNNKVYP